jgi:hypothetical protein
MLEFPAGNLGASPRAAGLASRPTGARRVRSAGDPPGLLRSSTLLRVLFRTRVRFSGKRTIRAEAARNGKSFIGVQRLEKLSPFDSPKTPRRKGKLNPRFAAGTAEGQNMGREMLQAFRSAYREAFKKWRNGLAAVFPAGTFGLARLARVVCAALETARPALDSG